LNFEIVIHSLTMAHSRIFKLRRMVIRTVERKKVYSLWWKSVIIPTAFAHCSMTHVWSWHVHQMLIKYVTCHCWALQLQEKMSIWVQLDF